MLPGYTRIPDLDEDPRLTMPLVVVGIPHCQPWSSNWGIRDFADHDHRGKQSVSTNVCAAYQACLNSRITSYFNHKKNLNTSNWSPMLEKKRCPFLTLSCIRYSDLQLVLTKFLNFFYTKYTYTIHNHICFAKIVM